MKIYSHFIPKIDESLGLLLNALLRKKSTIYMEPTEEEKQELRKAFDVEFSNCVLQVHDQEGVEKLGISVESK